MKVFTATSLGEESKMVPRVYELQTSLLSRTYLTLRFARGARRQAVHTVHVRV